MKQQLYSNYDFIVIGDHLAALWGAKLLLEKGLKVLIVPLGSVRTKNFAPQFILDAFEMKTDLKVNRDLDPIQILSPHRRHRVFSTDDALKQECEFVFSQNINDLSKLDSDFVRGMAYLYRGAETAPVNTDDWRSIHSRVNEMVYFQKEPGWLKAHFLEHLIQLGGHVLPEGRLNRIFVEKKAFVGIQVDDSSSIVAGSRVLIAGNWNVIQTLMSEPSSLVSKPSAWNFEFKLKVSQEAIPVGLTSQMIWVQKDSPVIEIEHAGKGDFILRTALPYEAWTLDRVEQRKICQRLLEVMGKVIPDLEYNVSQIFPDIRDPERAEQVDLVELYPFHSLAQIPSSLLTYSVPGLGLQTGVQGMTFAYDEAFPRVGEWGAYQAVLQSIQDWAKLAQRPDLVPKIQLFQ